MLIKYIAIKIAWPDGVETNLRATHDIQLATRDGKWFIVLIPLQSLKLKQQAPLYYEIQSSDWDCSTNPENPLTIMGFDVVKAVILEFKDSTSKMA